LAMLPILGCTSVLMEALLVMILFLCFTPAVLLQLPVRSWLQEQSRYLVSLIRICDAQTEKSTQLL
jgi:hypothetical protein